VLSVLWLLFIVLQLLDDPPALLQLRMREAAMLTVMGVMALGLVAAGRWERVAPPVVIAAYLLFSALEGELMSGWFLFFPALALLYLGCGWAERVMSDE
jgi:hypothetical protein